MAALPSVIYAIQNVLIQFAYQNLSSLTFTTINQTKNIWAAVFLYFVMGRTQTKVQMFSLCLLFVAAGMSHLAASLALLFVCLERTRQARCGRPRAVVWGSLFGFVLD